MTFKTLYSRTNTGAIQQWQVIVGENFYRTIYGQKDGQLVATDPSLCLGKNLGKANEITILEWIFLLVYEKVFGNVFIEQNLQPFCIRPRTLLEVNPIS